MLLLICLVWNKASEIVREFSSGNIVFHSTNSKVKEVPQNTQHGGGGKEVHHVAFLKVHKTGSSSVQNIFLRFGYSRNLTFVLAHDKKELAESAYPNMISYSNSLTEKNIVPPPEGRHYEIMCCHVIFNRTQFEKYLPTDTYYIGLVREPITRLESAIRYFNLFSNNNLSEYAANPLKLEKGPHSMSNNRMAFEFGYPLTLFPNSHEKPTDLQKAIDEYTKELFQRFDLIMINERMDESLVLMKRVLNWHVKDILYTEKLVAKRMTRRFNDTDIRNLKTFLYLDHHLYQRALDEFSAKVTDLGDEFQEEVANYQKEKSMASEFCMKSNISFIEFSGTKWNSKYTVTREDCDLLNKFEINFIQTIRLKQYGKIGI